MAARTGARTGLLQPVSRRSPTLYHSATERVGPNIGGRFKIGEGGHLDRVQADWLISNLAEPLCFHDIIGNVR